jgi:hypothetical protein
MVQTEARGPVLAFSITSIASVRRTAKARKNAHPHEELVHIS